MSVMKRVERWLCIAVVAIVVLYAAWQFLVLSVYGILTGQFW